MFSGIVEIIGNIFEATYVDDNLNLSIMHDGSFSDLQIGDSVAVNGVCLTVTNIPQIDTFHVTAVPETLRLTNIGELGRNSQVNLERSITANMRIGGHFVQGHVDATAEVVDISLDGNNAMLVTLTINRHLQKYIVNKGYITIDGMSITIIEANKRTFSVTFIPHTRDNTIVKNYQLGSVVNIEVDMMAKYIEKYLQETNYANAS